MSKLFRRYAKLSFPVTLRGDKKENLAEALRPYVEHLGLGTQEFTFEVAVETPNYFECIVTSFVKVSNPWSAFHELTQYLTNFQEIAMANRFAQSGTPVGDTPAGFFDSMKDNEDQFARMQKVEGVETTVLTTEDQPANPASYNKWLQRRESKHDNAVQRDDVVSSNT